MNISDLLYKAINLEASDIHITVGVPPMVRKNGNLIKLCEKTLTQEQIKIILEKIASEKILNKIETDGECDFSISIQSGYRFRVNAYKEKGNYAIALRVIAQQIPDFNSLGLPKILKTFTQKNKGLVLVTGPTGSGKSTTLASLIDIININTQSHIITIEDPIEYVHNHKNSIISQREIGHDTKDFNSALKSILRQDPDVILIGEMRDAETISVALTAAETGHLVFSTLHTIGAAKTIDRIIDSFALEQQQQIRIQLSTVIEGIVSQQLIPTSDGQGRVAAIEVMTATPAIRNLIREGKNHQIQSTIQTSMNFGMQTMDQDLIKLYKQGKINREMVLSRCNYYDFTSKSIGSIY